MALKEWNQRTTEGGNVLWQSTRKDKSDQITVSIDWMPTRKPKNLYFVEKGLLVGRPKVVAVYKTKIEAMRRGMAYIEIN